MSLPPGCYEPHEEPLLLRETLVAFHLRRWPRLFF
jgi:hypothetical protein